MTQEQKEILTYIYYTLEMNINDKSKTYEHSVEENGIVETFEVNREKHLEEVMYWAAQEIEKRFDVTVKKWLEKEVIKWTSLDLQMQKHL